MEQFIGLTGGGQLSVREEGAQVCLRASREADGRGLYKVWLRGDRGRYLLGTLAPEGGGLELRRRLSRESLARAGCWPVTGGECVLAFSFERSAPAPEWRREEAPAGRMADPVLKHALEGRPMLCREEKGGSFCLAARFDPAGPFPIPTLFCLAKVMQIQGVWRAVFRFDEDGSPMGWDESIDRRPMGTIGS